MWWDYWLLKEAYCLDYSSLWFTLGPKACGDVPCKVLLGMDILPCLCWGGGVLFFDCCASLDPRQVGSSRVLVQSTSVGLQVIQRMGWARRDIGEVLGDQGMEIGWEEMLLAQATTG